MLIDRDKIQIEIEIPRTAYKACLKMKSDDDDGLLGFCLINAVANGRTTEQPSAEPQIIRCKDCKYHDGIRCFQWNSTIETQSDDYCSNAERRTNG